MNSLLKIRKEVIANLREIQSSLSSTEALKDSFAQLEEERSIVAQLVQQLIDQNARVVQDQADYQRRYTELMERYEKADAAVADAQNELHQKENRNAQIKAFIAEVSAMPESITEFRTDYFGHMVEKITVYQNRTVFTFSCGMEIEA